jgi:hypothetical protein
MTTAIASCLRDALEHNAVLAAQINEVSELPVIAKLKDLRSGPMPRRNSTGDVNRNEGAVAIQRPIGRRAVPWVRALVEASRRHEGTMY